jgi:hypothetical protein
MASRLDVNKNGREHFSSHIWHRRPPDRPPDITPADGKVRSAGKISRPENNLVEGLEGKFRKKKCSGIDRASLYLLNWKFRRRKKKEEFFIKRRVSFVILTSGVPENLKKKDVYWTFLIFEKIRFFHFSNSNFSNVLGIFEISRKINFQESFGRLLFPLKKSIFALIPIKDLVNEFFRLRSWEPMFGWTPLVGAGGETSKTRAVGAHGETDAPGSAHGNQMRRGIPNIASLLRNKKGNALLSNLHSSVAEAKKEQECCPFYLHEESRKNDKTGKTIKNKNFLLFPIFKK